MNHNSIQKELLHYKAPKWDDFPDVELYIGQVVPLLTGWLQPLYFDSSKPCLTSSMINNYVKCSIVKPPVKKRYRNYHLAFLYVVMVLKQCFTLSEIYEMINIYSSINHSENTARNFNSFSRIFQSMLEEILETGKVTQTFYEHPTPEQILMIEVIRSVVCRLYATSALQSFNASETK